MEYKGYEITTQYKLKDDIETFIILKDDKGMIEDIYFKGIEQAKYYIDNLEGANNG